MEYSLVDKQLKTLVEKENIHFGNKNIQDLLKHIQPASIDVPITSICYLVKEKVLPFGTKIRDLLPNMILQEYELPNLENSNDLDEKESVVLLKGQTYLVYCGHVNLPETMRGSLSPKSSIGRVDLMVRGIFDNCGLYDTIEHGKSGELWMEISPRSFNVRIFAGLSLTQLMIFENSAVMATTIRSNTPIKKRQKKTPDSPPLLDPQTENVVFDADGTPIRPTLHNNSLVLSLRVPTSAEGILGFESLPTNEVVDLSKIGAHDPTYFFRELKANQRKKSSLSDTPNKQPRTERASVTLEKDKFYILATKEKISIPYNLSAEMVPFSQHIGELRAHYAGFFDPGFGYREGGRCCGTVGVLEVRPHETITVYDGQPIALMEFYRNVSNPDVPYGMAGNHYQDQSGPKLSKYFSEVL